MLKEEDAIRTEYHYTKSGRKLLVYVFKCSDCNSEIKPRAGCLKRYTGKCTSCCHKIEKYKVRYNLLKASAKDRNIRCKLTFNQFVTFTNITNCFYCDTFINWDTSTHSNGGKAYYLDRIDSKVGYVKDNCVVCCTECNRMKMDASTEDFINKCKQIAKKFKKY